MAKSYKYLFLKIASKGAARKTQWLSALDALAEDSRSVPSTHIQFPGFQKPPLATAFMCMFAHVNKNKLFLTTRRQKLAYLCEFGISLGYPVSSNSTKPM